jgi:ankyrin repeat protein
LTALYEATRNGHKEVTKVLMANGAEVKRNGAFDLAPLHISAANSYEEIVKCLIEKDKNI